MNERSRGVVRLGRSLLLLVGFFVAVAFLWEGF